MIKVRNTFVGFLALAVTGVLGFYLFVRPDSGGDAVLVSAVVVFSPNPRTESVTVVVAVNGSLYVSEDLKESPWTESVPVPRGSTVTLSAVQKANSGSLSCKLTALGRTVGPMGNDLTPRPGTSGCLVSITV